jgi:hypothetical protein
MNKPFIIYYQNCKKRKANQLAILEYAFKEEPELMILAEASSFDFKLFKDYKFQYLSNNKSGFNILSMFELELKHIQFDSKETRNKDRIVLIKLDNIQIIAVHIPAETNYHYQAMEKLLSLDLTDIDLVIGDFNTGYRDDSDINGIQFKSGDKNFHLLESNGFTNYGRGKGIKSYRNNRNGNLVRIDHAFIKNSSTKVEYIDFLSEGFDHRGIKVALFDKR